MIEAARVAVEEMAGPSSTVAITAVVSAATTATHPANTSRTATPPPSTVELRIQRRMAIPATATAIINACSANAASPA